MPISEESNKISYNTDGLIREFSFNFKFLQPSNIKVSFWTKDEEDNSTESVELEEGRDYTLIYDDAEEGGFVVLTESSAEEQAQGKPKYPATPTSGTLLVARIMPLDQQAHIRPVSGFPEEVITNTFDKLVMIDQQQQEQLDRCVKVSDVSDINPEVLVQQVERIHAGIEDIVVVADHIEDVEYVAANGEAVLQAAEDSLANVEAAKGHASDAAASAGTAAIYSQSCYNMLEDSREARDVATEQAGISTAQASVAAEQANIATEQANIAAEQAGISTAQASAAEEQANVATEQAGVATEQAGVATEQAGISTAQAGVATEQAGIAATQADIATARADEIKQYAANASISEANALNYASEASASAYNSEISERASETSATNSKIWAEGTDEEVQALGGVHSSKTWAEIGSNAGGKWGNILGDIKDQADLQTALDNKADDNQVVHLANAETINGAKTFTQPIKIQNGAGTGSLLIGGDVNAGTLTNGTRKLARIAVPTQTNKDLMATLLGFDSNGDDALKIKNKTYDAISFGGQTKISNATSPMSLGFCVTKTRNSTSASDKVYVLEMDSTEARFNVQPNYNGVNLATTVDVTNALGSYAKLTDIPDISNLATKTELEAKQDTLTAGENIEIDDNVISAKGGGREVGEIIKGTWSKKFVPKNTLYCGGTEFSGAEGEMFHELYTKKLLGEITQDDIVEAAQKPTNGIFQGSSSFLMFVRIPLTASSVPYGDLLLNFTTGSDVTTEQFIYKFISGSTETTLSIKNGSFATRDNTPAVAIATANPNTTYTLKITSGLQVSLIENGVETVIGTASSFSTTYCWFFGNAGSGSISGFLGTINLLTSTYTNANGVSVPLAIMQSELDTCTYAEYETELTMTGSCWKWAVDTANEKFRIPFIPDKVLVDVADTTNAKTYKTIRHFVVVATGSVEQTNADWTNFANGLASKANNDLSNVEASQSYKDKAIAWGVPDYTKKIDIELVAGSAVTFVAPSAGVVYGKYRASTAERTITINGIMVNKHFTGSGTSVDSFYYTISKDDIVSINTYSIASPVFASFAPMKGVN